MMFSASLAGTVCSKGGRGEQGRARKRGGERERMSEEGEREGGGGRWEMSGYHMKLGRNMQHVHKHNN